jgi:spermidine/putrescine transport system permease protein
MNFVKRILQEEYPFIFALPAFMWQLFFLYLPLVSIVVFSFLEFSPLQGFLGFSFSYYVKIFKLVYLKVILNSFFLALFTSIICLVISYPVAYFLALKVKRFKTLFLFGLVLPSWTNLIVQIYAWFFLLERRSIISKLLCYIGIFSEPRHMINSYFSTMIGMVYCFLPFMILPIYTVLEKMNRSLLEASSDLGASRFVTFRKVILPISLPGIYTGLLLVFVPAFGEFVIPSLLGGAKKAYWGTVIVDKFLISGEWRSGFAIATVGVLFLGLFIGLLFSVFKIVKVLKTKRFKLKIQASKK